jgi:hypothetical protein
VISEGNGLQASGTVVYEPVNVGAVKSAVHVTVEEAVAELPQPSEAVNVLICDLEQPLVDIAPSVNATIGVPHAAEAVAVPRAALISEAVGLQPRVGVAPVIVIVGGLGALVHVTVLVMVAVLPHPSIAINVLVCEAEQLVVDTVPSVKVIVGVAQPSVAVAEPKAAVISEACGLQPRGTVVYDPVNVGGVISAVHVTVLVMVAVLPHSSLAINVLVCDALQLLF